MRIGHGFDAHTLVEGRPLILGGVMVPFARGLAGHSDADVLVHAVTSACLGAAGLGDLGQHFPASDERYRNCDSRTLLCSVRQMLVARAWKVVNVDATIIAEAPRLAPYTPRMAEHLAADLGISRADVNVKVTTTEGMGYTGRGEGMGAHAVVLLERASGV